MDTHSKYIDIHSGPDNLGRYVYTLYWWDTYIPQQHGQYIAGWRGQVYHAKIRKEMNEYVTGRPPRRAYHDK